MSTRVVVLGGGLAGLSCAYELARNGAEVTVLEREEHVGGMASSFVDEGSEESWSYDFGPHRFHTTEVELIDISYTEHVMWWHNSSITCVKIRLNSYH
jgi:phytoene dehydrogenase-like protein